VPETRVIDLIFAADSMSLCLLPFTQLRLKVEPSESKSASTKTEFDIKYPFKVILGHSFCNELQAGKERNVTISEIRRLIG